MPDDPGAHAEHIVDVVIAVDVEQVRGRDILLVATQMVLDLIEPVSPPERVTLRPMTGAEFVGYRDQLVTAYAQDLALREAEAKIDGVQVQPVGESKRRPHELLVGMS